MLHYDPFLFPLALVLNSGINCGLVWQVCARGGSGGPGSVPLAVFCYLMGGQVSAGGTNGTGTQ